LNLCYFTLSFVCLLDGSDKKNSKENTSTKEENEFRKIMSGKATKESDLTLEEKMFLSSLDNDKPSSSSSCVIC
jgi:hypothetical protein